MVVEKIFENYQIFFNNSQISPQWKRVTLHVSKLEFYSPKNVLCQVLLKSTYLCWIKRRKSYYEKNNYGQTGESRTKNDQRTFFSLFHIYDITYWSHQTLEAYNHKNVYCYTPLHFRIFLRLLSIYLFLSDSILLIF